MTASFVNLAPTKSDDKNAAELWQKLGSCLKKADFQWFL
jgi:hypothetical protein